jgi:hypothetical protein
MCAEAKLIEALSLTTCSPGRVAHLDSNYMLTWSCCSELIRCSENNDVNRLNDEPIFDVRSKQDVACSERRLAILGTEDSTRLSGQTDCDYSRTRTRQNDLFSDILRRHAL